MKNLLLCTDLDRTLIPNGPQPESRLARKIFNDFTSLSEITLVYVTGRNKSLIQQAIKSYKLPTPDFVIADVGSTIYQIVNNDWIHLEKWGSEISSDWNNKSHQDLQDMLHQFNDIRIQEYNKQNTHKLSYYVPLHVDHEVLLDEINSYLINNGVNASIIWSIDTTANLGLLDILPASANKKHAIEFLMKQFNFDITETIFAGDSGNDIAVINSAINSILVANAEKDIIKIAIDHANENNQSNSLYIAKGDFLGMNGNYTAGVLEGIVHYIPDVRKFMMVK